MALQLLSFKLLARGHGSLLLADRYSMAKFFTHIMAITGFMTRKRLRFKVTPKGLSDVPLRTYAPQLILVVVTLLAVAWAIPMQLFQSEFDVPGWGPLAFWVNLVFAGWNAYVALYIVRMSIRMKQKRSDHRFSEAMPVEARIMRADGKLRTLELAVIEDLNPHGVGLRSILPLEDGTRLEIALPLSTRKVNTRGRVLHRREVATAYGSVHIHGVQFDELDWNDRDAIELHCAQHSTPLKRQRYGDGASDTIARRLFRDLRSEPRTDMGMPAWMIVGQNGVERNLGLALLEDVSSYGARVLTDHPVAPGSFVRLQIPNSAIKAEGTVTSVRPLETSLGVRFVVGLDTRPPSVREPQPLPAAALVKAKTQKLPKLNPVIVKAAPAPVPEPLVVLVTISTPLITAASLLETGNEEETMERQSTVIAHTPRSGEVPLLSIAGKAARLEGKFDIADSIEVECEVWGKMTVGGKLVIGRNGNVNADVRTVDALIMGNYSGTLIASGTIEIAETGRVTGNVETPEFVIARGGVFSGNVTRPAEQLPEPVSQGRSLSAPTPGVIAMPLESVSLHSGTK